jgi:hypothetical protein
MQKGPAGSIKAKRPMLRVPYVLYNERVNFNTTYNQDRN